MDYQTLVLYSLIMDNEIKAAFDEVTQRQDRDGARLANVQVRVEQVHGLVREGQEEQRRHHGQQMRAFQDVIAEVRSERDRRLADAEAAIVELRAQVAALKVALAQRQ